MKKLLITMFLGFNCFVQASQNEPTISFYDLNYDLNQNELIYINEQITKLKQLQVSRHPEDCLLINFTRPTNDRINILTFIGRHDREHNSILLNEKYEDRDDAKKIFNNISRFVRSNDEILHVMTDDLTIGDNIPNLFIIPFED